MSEREKASTPPLLSGVVTVGEAAAHLDVDRKTLYAEIAAGRFPAIHIGRAIRIPRAVLTLALEHGRLQVPRTAARR